MQSKQGGPTKGIRSAPKRIPGPGRQCCMCSGCRTRQGSAMQARAEPLTPEQRESGLFSAARRCPPGRRLGGWHAAPLLRLATGCRPPAIQARRRTGPHRSATRSLVRSGRHSQSPQTVPPRIDYPRCSMQPGLLSAAHSSPFHSSPVRLGLYRSSACRC